jgi:hypothetical protein
LGCSAIGGSDAGVTLIPSDLQLATTKANTASLIIPISDDIPLKSLNQILIRIFPLFLQNFANYTNRLVIDLDLPSYRLAGVTVAHLLDIAT